MKTPILQMRGVAKRFGGVHALKGVDLAVDAGEVVALIGENGAGKSTLMKILGGVHQPDAGEIIVDGEQVEIHNVNDASRYGIGFVHQELNVLDNLDVAGNVFLGREPLRGGVFKLIDNERMKREAKVYLERLGLHVASSTPLSRLSIAQRQLVEIAKALSQNARILILDEPTSSLTLTETERLLEIIKELRTGVVGIIYISHRLNEIQEIADRVVGLRDGANAGGLERAEISHERMVNMMVGRELAAFEKPETVSDEADKNYFRIEDLRTRRYPHHAVNLEIAKGEILGLSGLVGSGRTEIAEAIFGVDGSLPRVVLNDKTVRVSCPAEAIKHGIYLVPEDRRHQGLLITSSVRENVTLPALDRYANAGLISFTKEHHAASTICKQLNVKTASLETPCINLSGGNQQKVVLAKWVGLNPKVLIFDEPTRGVDVGAKAEIYELMRRLAVQGVSILMISSDMEEILRMSDRVAVMHEGRLSGILTRDEATEESLMRLAVGKNIEAKTMVASV